MATIEKGSKEAAVMREKQIAYNNALRKHKFAQQDCPLVTAASLYHGAQREFRLDLEFAMGRHKGGVAK